MGPAATAAQVEAVSRALLDEFLTRPQTAAEWREDADDRDRLVAFVVGTDGPDLVSSISDVLTDAGCAILSVRSHHGTENHMTLQADAAGAGVSLSDLGRRLDTVAARYGARAGVQHEALFKALNGSPV